MIGCEPSDDCRQSSLRQIRTALHLNRNRVLIYMPRESTEVVGAVPWSPGSRPGVALSSSGKCFIVDHLLSVFVHCFTLCIWPTGLGQANIVDTRRHTHRTLGLRTGTGQHPIILRVRLNRTFSANMNKTEH